MSKERRTEIPSRCLSCLLYLVIMPMVWAHRPRPCARELFNLVKGLVLNSTEEALYTPNTTDYEKCSKSILRCFAEEMKVLVYHNPALGEFMLPKRLLKWSLKMKDENEHCPQCEVHDMQPVETFLLMLNKILKQFNDRCQQEP
ncbi:hypothetical protein AAFF_G00037650 [Aldrovandia affinis]|uniref:Interleukin n=1 Tax=Aldrovandia affinis TaxID=143900 RepID=A0AAD7T5C7_9TELE|nr:hypothetical protein AAFF_G00037650 [Aldrovandia affinis]